MILILQHYSANFMILAFSYRMGMLKTHSTATGQNKNCSVNHIFLQRPFIKTNTFAVINITALLIKSLTHFLYRACNYWSKHVNNTQTPLSRSLGVGRVRYLHEHTSPGMQLKSRYRPLHFLALINQRAAKTTLLGRSINFLSST